ncbi:MAG: LuxR C-terminal-related transcriptional regulator, partial [Proteobacteria bacterium]|nr:LuxR C-terminal-related transcriptional regulator [Pseudomonadota bacterium]
QSLQEIADNYHLSIKTVSTYRSRLLSKLMLKNNVELALFAVRNNIIDP